MIRPSTRDVSGPLTEFSPVGIFSGGDAGFFLPISPDTCFTDVARTTPAGVGDNVKGIEDQSGNDLHFQCLSTGPVLRQDGRRHYLEFTGAGAAAERLDSLLNLELSGASGVSFYAAFRCDVVNVKQTILACDISGQIARMSLLASSEIRYYGYRTVGTGFNATTTGDFAEAEKDYVIGGEHDNSGIYAYAGGLEIASSINLSGTINQAASAVQIGTRFNGDPLFGRIYSVFGITRRLSAQERNLLSAYMR